MTTLTPEDRARLRDLASRATPGPWERGNWYHVQGSSHCECRPDYGPLVGIDPHGSFGEMHVHRYPDKPLWDEGIRARDDSTGGVDVVVETTEYGTMSPADAEFIAATRTAIPALLDALDAAEAELDRLHSWAGLMELLDEHYPADLIPTAPDDPARDAGPRIVSLIRRVDAAEAAVERVRALHVRVPYADAPEYGYCGRCQRGGAAGVWPCETLRALDGEA